MKPNLRKRFRKSLDIKIKIKQNGSDLDATTIDLSTGGLSFITERTYVRPGQLFELQFDIPLRGRFLKIKAQAKVVHATACGIGSYRVGLKFLKLDTLSSWAVQSFIANPTDILPPLPSTSIWDYLPIQ